MAQRQRAQATRWAWAARRHRGQRASGHSCIALLRAWARTRNALANVLFQAPSLSRANSILRGCERPRHGGTWPARTEVHGSSSAPEKGRLAGEASTPFVKRIQVTSRETESDHRLCLYGSCCSLNNPHFWKVVRALVLAGKALCLARQNYCFASERKANSSPLLILRHICLTFQHRV